MDDAELTRLAIAEIVREMGEANEAPVLERKINPIAKPNKRFLGRTLNSMLSHNKRKNDRTQENCRKKLKELDERREIVKRMRSRSRSGSWELVLSSSSDEDHSREERKKINSGRKSRHKKHKKTSKRKSKSKKDKRRKSSSSSSSSSSDESNESSSSTSRSSGHGRKNKLRKRSKPKKRKILQPDDNTNAIEGVAEEVYYEPDINAAMEFDAALLANNYRQHHMQQLLYYQTLMAGHESSEIEALKEEMRISDSELTETQKKKESICSAVSSLNLNESDSDAGEMLQISLSSATSSGSEAKSNTNIRKKKVKRKDTKADLLSASSDATNSNAVIWELDSDSSDGDKISEIKEISENGECICITSESEASTSEDSETENSTSEKYGECTNNTNKSNTLCHAEAETVTLLSSSDSEVEIISSNCAEAPKKLPDSVTTAITTQFTDPTFACEKKADLVPCGPETNTISISEENLTLNGADESAQKLPDPVTDSTSACEEQSHLVSCGSDTNAISMSKENSKTVFDDAVVSAPETPTNFSVEVASLVTTTECSSLSEVDATETKMPCGPLEAPQDLIKETRIPESNENTLEALLAPTDPINNAMCESNASELKTVGTDVAATARIDQENVLLDNYMSSKAVNEPIKESADEIPSNVALSSPTGPSVSSSPKAISSITPQTTSDKTELNLDSIED